MALLGTVFLAGFSISVVFRAGSLDHSSLASGHSETVSLCPAIVDHSRFGGVTDWRVIDNFVLPSVPVVIPAFQPAPRLLPVLAVVGFT